MRKLSKLMVWDGEKIKKVYEILEKEYEIIPEDYVSLWAYLLYRNPFKVLIATILSQSSTDKAALKSFKKLEEDIGVEPSKLVKAKIEEIANAIRESGLQNQKAKAIKEIAEIMLNTNLEEIMKEDIQRAREKLVSLPKVGYKTADVLLASFGKPIIPIDTHVERVVKRLGIIRKEAKYEEIRMKLEEIVPENYRHKFHLLLIAHGRKTCKSKMPLCSQCKIFEYCEYPEKKK